MTLTPQEYAKANIGLILDLMAQDQGICLACDDITECPEGDLEYGACPSCGARKFFAAEQLILYVSTL